MSDLMDFQIPEANNEAIIKVVGVGGGGGNAVNHMYHEGIKDVEFMICNTDAQALQNSVIPNRIQLGASLTEGRGAGNEPDKGREAARESCEKIKEVLSNKTKMVFVTAGMGGGTGTGAAPVIAEIARELGILTVGIVTIPFRSEGKKRQYQAITGIRELQEQVDSLLVINNERIKDLYGDFPVSQAFAKADGILSTAAKGIAEIITVHGFINVDFADVEAVMRNSGVAVMGSAEATGEGRALEAVTSALNSPLLNDNNIKGAKDILINIYSGDPEATMSEVDAINEYVQDSAGNDANLIWGNGKDESLGESLRVTVIATGFSDDSIPVFGGSSAKKPITNDGPFSPQEQITSTPENTVPSNASRYENQGNGYAHQQHGSVQPNSPYQEQQSYSRHQNYDPSNSQSYAQEQGVNQSEQISTNAQPVNPYYANERVGQNHNRVQQEQINPHTGNSPYNQHQDVNSNGGVSHTSVNQNYPDAGQMNAQPETITPQPATTHNGHVSTEEYERFYGNKPNEPVQGGQFQQDPGYQVQSYSEVNIEPAPIPVAPQSIPSQQQVDTAEMSNNQYANNRDFMKRNFANVADEEIDSLSSMPAWERKKNRNNNSSTVRDFGDTSIGKGDNGPQLQRNNRYLHDNVD